MCNKVEKEGVHTLLGHLDVTVAHTVWEGIYNDPQIFLRSSGRLLFLTSGYPKSEELHTWTCASDETVWERGNVQPKVFWKLDKESNSYVPGPEYTLFGVFKQQREQALDR